VVLQVGAQLELRLLVVLVRRRPGRVEVLDAKAGKIAVLAHPVTAIEDNPLKEREGENIYVADRERFSCMTVKSVMWHNINIRPHTSHSLYSVPFSIDPDPCISIRI
jgi:hypothetical protein